MENLERLRLKLKRGDSDFFQDVIWDTNKPECQRIHKLLKSIWKDSVFRLSDHRSHLIFDGQFSFNRNKTIYIMKQSSRRSFISEALDGAGTLGDHMPKDAWVKKNAWYKERLKSGVCGFVTIALIQFWTNLRVM